MERDVDRETAVLRALGSPVRQAILETLGRGPATSAMLARALRSNTGVMSYHLRELGKAGLIETDVRAGRSLFLRLSRTDTRFNDPQTSAEPLLANAAIDLILARFNASVRTYLTRTDLDGAWRDATLFSQSAALLTEAELAAFAEEYLALVRRFTAPRAEPAGAQPVRLALFAFPDTYTASPEGPTA
jgi:DNA-binding transcriptional ArsR family regulator